MPIRQMILTVILTMIMAIALRPEQNCKSAAPPDLIGFCLVFVILTDRSSVKTHMPISGRPLLASAPSSWGRFLRPDDLVYRNAYEQIDGFSGRCLKN